MHKSSSESGKEEISDSSYTSYTVVSVYDHISGGNI